MFHELLWRDDGDGRATWQPQGVGLKAYLNGTSQGSTPEDARKGEHIRGRSRPFMKHPGQLGASCYLPRSWNHGNREPGSAQYSSFAVI